MNNQPLILAVDLGTTAIKVALYDAQGGLAAAASREYELLTPTNGWVEVDCATYWSAFKGALARLGESPHVDLQRITAIGISAQGETIVPVGQDGAALRNAIVWLDNRAHQEADELAATFGSREIYEITGQPEMLATWPAAKLLWLTRREPWLAERAAKYLLIEDYFIFKLTGEVLTEGSLATSTCYWNFRTKSWWSEMLAEIGVRQDQLPRLVEPGTAVGSLRGEVASELGLAPKTAVCTGALDQACGAIGSGNIAAGGFSENTGAAIALCATLEEPRLDPERQMPCHYHGLPDTYMFHTFTSGGIVLRWFRDEFFQAELKGVGRSGGGYDELDRLADAVRPGADGLLMLPYLQGAMAPENNDQARGALLGLTLAHGRPHIARAIMESIAFIVRRNVEVLRQLGVPVESVRAIGGGSRSPVWKQIEADVLDLPVVTMQQPDAGTLGAAILAGVGIGWWRDIADAVARMVVEDTTYEPNTANRQLYEDRYRLFTSAYAALEPLFPAFAGTPKN